MPRALGCIRLNIGPPSTRTSTTINWSQVRRPPVLGVGQGAVQHLFQQPGTAVRLVAEDVQGVVGMFAADQIRQRAHLAGADPRESMHRFVSHVASL